MARLKAPGLHGLGGFLSGAVSFAYGRLYCLTWVSCLVVGESGVKRGRGDSRMRRIVGDLELNLGAAMMAECWVLVLLVNTSVR